MIDMKEGFYLDFIPLTVPLILLWFGSKYNWYLFSFNGKLKRKPYGLLLILSTILISLFVYISYEFGNDLSLWYQYSLLILTYVAFTITLSAGMRRMTDVGLKYWWYLIVWATVLFFPDFTILKNAAIGLTWGLLAVQSK